MLVYFFLDVLEADMGILLLIQTIILNLLKYSRLTVLLNVIVCSETLLLLVIK
jgi:hypothetical protein